MNPFSDGMYDVLTDLFDEYLDIFNSDSFHVGGDEVRIVFLRKKYNWKLSVSKPLIWIGFQFSSKCSLIPRLTKHVGHKAIL